MCIHSCWDLSFFISTESLQGEYQRKLYKELMNNYNRLERPVLNDSSPIVVELGLTLLQIIDVVSFCVCFSFLWSFFHVAGLYHTMHIPLPSVLSGDLQLDQFLHYCIHWFQFDWLDYTWSTMKVTLLGFSIKIKLKSVRLFRLEKPWIEMAQRMYLWRKKQMAIVKKKKLL